MADVLDIARVTVGFKLAGDHIKMPTRATTGSAGLDLAANEEKVLKPFSPTVVGTGIILHMPEGYEGQIRSRSGLALHNSVIVLNSPATIDSDYRGELGVILMNLGTEDFIVVRGMRIAQLVVAKLTPISIEVITKELDATERGMGGFGSTGLFSSETKSS